MACSSCPNWSADAPNIFHRTGLLLYRFVRNCTSLKTCWNLFWLYSRVNEPNFSCDGSWALDLLEAAEPSCSFSLSKPSPWNPWVCASLKTAFASSIWSSLIKASIWLNQNWAILELTSKAVLKNGSASLTLPTPTARTPILWFASGCLGCTFKIAV